MGVFIQLAIVRVRELLLGPVDLGSLREGNLPRSIPGLDIISYLERRRVSRTLEDTRFNPTNTDVASILLVAANFVRQELDNRRSFVV